jgi:hypothetical protein
MKAEVKRKVKMDKAIFVTAIASAIVTLVLSIITVWKARITGSKKSLRAGFLYAGIALGWAATAFWPEVWNWGLPTLLIVGVSLLSSSDK